MNIQTSAMIEQARFNMIEQQIRPWEVLDPRVLECFASLPRERFVPPAHAALAFADVALPLGHGQHMFKPVLEGRTLQALQLQPGDEALEIGTGSGFLSACLAHLVRSLHSIDIEPEFIEAARRKVQALGISNASFECADALQWQAPRPYDAICVSAAVDRVPTRFLEWLKPGGRLFIVRGASPVMEALCITRVGDAFSEESLFETDIDHLRGAEPRPTFRL